MEKILITGARGYIGGYLWGNFKNQYNLYATDIQNYSASNYLQCDLLNLQSVRNMLNDISPEVLIHCAGTKDLFGCEKDPVLAQKLNTQITENLINAVRSAKIKFIFISSDYVFRGDKGNYKETDIPEPSTVYGRNKLQCEKHIEELASYSICRTAAVYGVGSKLFDFILNSLKEKKVLDMYADSFFSPTYIGNLKDMINAVIQKNIKGILHTAGSERISRYNFAVKLAKIFNYDMNLISPVGKPKDSPIAYDSSLETAESMRKINVKSMSIEEGLGCIRRGECILEKQK